MAWITLLAGSTGALMGLDPDRRIDQYGHDAWTSQRGLPGEAVYQILQSRDGYLWMRTSAGLVRFDGVRFVAMDSVIGTEPVKAIAMSADGDLLVRTTAHTVVYKNGAFTDYRPPGPLPDGDIKTIFETREHEVLIGSDDFLYSNDRGGIRLVRRKTSTIRAMLQDDTGKVWVNGPTKVYSFHGGTLRDEATSGSAIASMAEDDQHRLWVGTTHGVFQLLRPSGGPARLEPVDPDGIKGMISAIAADHGGNLWFATSEDGLVRLGNQKLSSFGWAQGLTDNRVLSLFEDREGSLWVGTASGLDRFRNTSAVTYTTLEGLPSDTPASAILGRDGAIYIFCDNGGLARIKDGVVTATRHIPGLHEFFGSSLYQDRSGAVWMGTVGGLTRLKDGKFTVFKDPRLSTRFIPAISEDDESLIVTNSDTVALRVKDGKVSPYTIRGRMTPLSVPGNYTFSIYRAPSGTLWFGTVKGLFRFAPGEDPAKAQVSQIDFAVTSISDDGRGSLWLGGRTPGLIRYRISDGRVTHYKKRDGGFDNYPSRVLYDDNGDLWISSANGIYFAKRQDLDDFADGRISVVPTVIYGIADGMKTSEASSPASQPAGTRGTDGKLWFTTAKGIVMIDPRHLLHNALAPPVVVESVVVDGAETAARGDFEIPPGKDKIEFHYTALSLLIPDRVRFKYQLEGYDQHWVDAGSRRVAYYNNLPPGHYRFKVIAANNDGVWNEAGASIGFQLKPHFYQTRWFRGLCSLLALLLIVAGQRVSTRILRRRAAELSRLVDERTAELRESQRHLEQVAFLDSLTSLPNRRMFSQEFRKLLSLARRRGGSFSLLMIDLDRFKPINDTMGHDAGDLLLVEAARRLKEAVRETDCVARLGGDEFAILLAEDQDQASIDSICQRIVDNFVPSLPYETWQMKTTPSIGIAVFPDHGDSQEALCKFADFALYQAKRAGGNSWQWFRADQAREKTLVG